MNKFECTDSIRFWKRAIETLRYPTMKILWYFTRDYMRKLCFVVHSSLNEPDLAWPCKALHGWVTFWQDLAWVWRILTRSGTSADFLPRPCKALQGAPESRIFPRPYQASPGLATFADVTRRSLDRSSISQSCYCVCLLSLFHVLISI